MNVQFGEWYRIAKIEPTGEMLANRWDGVEVIKEKADKVTSINLVRLFLAPSKTPEEYVEAFRQTFWELDNSFRMRKNDKELQVLAGAAIIAIIEQKAPLSDTLASILIASAAPEIRESVLIPDVIEKAASLLFERSVAVRTIENVPAIPPGNFTPLIEAVKSAAATNQPAQLGVPLEQALKYLFESASAANQNQLEQVGAFRKTLNILSEETNIVWWLFGSVSRETNEAFKEMIPAKASLLAAVDLAALTKIIPPPRAAGAYLDRALDAHASTECTLEDIATQNEFEDLDGDGLFPIASLLNSVRNGKPAKSAATSISKLFNLQSTPQRVSRFSRQFYNELIAARLF